MKPISFYFTNGKDTYSGTHNRIDALAWGVLVSILLNQYGNKIMCQKKNIVIPSLFRCGNLIRQLVLKK